MSNEMFLKTFRRIAKEKKEIWLFNAYKGVPINYRANVLDVKKGRVHINTSEYQLVCLDHEKETFIQSDYFIDPVRAEVVELDFPNLEAWLSPVEFSNSVIGHRSLARVQPKEPIPVHVHNVDRGIKIKGELVDISLEGAAIFLLVEIFVQQFFKAGMQVIVRFQLPGDGWESEEEIKIRGTITNKKKETGKQLERVGLRIYPDEHTKLGLKKFVTQRHAEIRREVREIYNLLSYLAQKDE